MLCSTVAEVILWFPLKSYVEDLGLLNSDLKILFQFDVRLLGNWDK